ncbi:hypothetical protein FHG87_025385, partial [Trinorchestia longiramus]
ECERPSGGMEERRSLPRAPLTPRRCEVSPSAPSSRQVVSCGDRRTNLAADTELPHAPKPPPPSVRSGGVGGGSTSTAGQIGPSTPGSGGGKGVPSTPGSGGGKGVPSTPGSGRGKGGPSTPGSGGGKGGPSTPGSGGGKGGPSTPGSGGGKGVPSTPGSGGGKAGAGVTTRKPSYSLPPHPHHHQPPLLKTVSIMDTLSQLAGVNTDTHKLTQTGPPVPSVQFRQYTEEVYDSVTARGHKGEQLPLHVGEPRTGGGGDRGRRTPDWIKNILDVAKQGNLTALVCVLCCVLCTVLCTV